MICAWEQLLAILPLRLRQPVDRIGRESMQELRLRLNGPPEIICGNTSHWLSGLVSSQELTYTLNAASKYSPWTAASAAQGYLTVEGGHRVGICGEAIIRNGTLQGFREISSLCIRVARDFPGIIESAADISGSILILGGPGWGKTTLLRDLIRHTAKSHTVVTIDERGEIFPKGIDHGMRSDVMSGCSKKVGILMALRTMGPEYIAVDEITQQEDTTAIVKGSNCGVHFFATAHSPSLDVFFNRETYRPLLEHQVFDYGIVLKRDKTYTVERMAV